MAGFVAKIFTKKILGETIQNKFGTEDPYFEQVPATRLDGTPNGKFKKRKKALPPGISDHDGKVLTKVKRRAYRLDMSLFSCCGIRFGWGSVIGIIPAIGDVIDALMALMVMRTCAKIEGGLPAGVKSKMMFNIIFDFAIGLVPFVGDIVDAAFRANTKNAAILEAHLREVGRKNLRAEGRPIPAVDPSDPAEFDRFHSETPPEYVSRPPSTHEPMSSSQPHSSRNNNRHDNDRHAMPAEPEPARTRGGGWFSRNKSRPHDPELGMAQPSSRDDRRQKPLRKERR